MTDFRRYAPATERNRDPILAVLRRVLPATGTVLEIASGTGEHCAWFAQHLPALRFQPSDPDAASCASIAAWTGDLTNVEAPIALDVRGHDWAVPAPVTCELAAILCINMIHISPWAATVGLIRGAALMLPAGSPLFLYGPYKRNGVHIAPSNDAFDLDLRARNPEWGVRDLETVVAAATEVGFALAEVIDMPANNFSIVFRRWSANG